MVGYDGLFPEATRILTCLGAQVILYPCNWTLAAEPELILVERAAENRVAIVAANRCDSPVRRGSMIITLGQHSSEPHWKRRSPTPEEKVYGELGYLCATVDLADTTNKAIVPGTDLLWGRRPDFYGALVAH